jgi:hypothetical protein
MGIVQGVLHVRSKPLGEYAQIVIGVMGFWAWALIIWRTVRQFTD